MPNTSGAANTSCPYYERESEYSITCEGIVEHSFTVLKFASDTHKALWQKENCYHIACSCPIREMLDEKYEGLSAGLDG